MNFDFGFTISVGSLLSLLVGSFLILADKWGVIEWLQFRSPNKFFEKMYDCKYCMGHHLLFLFTAILFIAGVLPYDNPMNYLIPLTFAPVINKIL